jgi:4-hydroxy 2-oxovalerate aldolase
MRVSRLSDDAILRAAEQAEAAGADVFYLADSYGGMFPEDVTRLAGRLAAVTEAPLGLHAHDGLSLAFANSVAAVRAGFTYIDASLSGMGVDGGNLSLELIVAYLRVHAGQRLAIAPLAHASAALLTPWLGAGVAVREAAYAVIGMLDLDPADAEFPAAADFLAPGNADALFHALDEAGHRV